MSNHAGPEHTPLCEELLLGAPCGLDVAAIVHRDLDRLWVPMCRNHALLTLNGYTPGDPLGVRASIGGSDTPS